ncbi:MAG: carbohydrate ABC transporter permease [Thermoproteus sp. AZ2]|uniref:Carbohydrate ABC transporter permease n=1 Tax=Thermoproteus sp. AZ2 TaxID=1609232 RepID=A0ACC6V3F9_9CREN
MIRSLEWVIVLLGIGLPLAILISVSIYAFESARVRNALTTLFLIPFAIPPIASAILWRWMLDVFRGLDALIGINYPWLSATTTYWSPSFWSVALISLWIYTGFAVLYFLASFYNIEPSQIESAKIDGASYLRIVTSILLPQSGPAIVVVSTFLIAYAFGIFDVVLVLSGTYLANTNVFSYGIYIYNTFLSGFIPRASAAAVILAILLFL